MDYQAYMSSPSWAQKRQQRLEIDGYRCRLCDHDGSEYRLEVHHRPSSYKLIPNESVHDDLTTVCSRCHDFITDIVRGERYGSRVITVDVVAETKIERENYGMEKRSLSVDIILSDDRPQRANSVTAKQILTLTETDFVKEEKSRRGL